MVRAFIDANVLVKRLLRDIFLGAASQGLFELLWSDDVLNEIYNTLTGQLGLSAERASDIIQTIEELFPKGCVRNYDTLTDRVRQYVGDPNDCHVLAAAVRGRANFLVTLNVRDFRRVTRAYGVTVVQPDDFLCRLLQTDRKRVLRVLDLVARSYQNPPHTIQQILHNLQSDAPRFVEAVTQFLP